MKRLVNWLVLSVFTVSLVFASCGCTEKQPDGQTQQPAAPSDLMTLLYQLVEEQSADVPRKRVYIVSHRANTLQGVKDYVPENSIRTVPFGSGEMKPSCFSLVRPVSGWNQCVK